MGRSKSEVSPWPAPPAGLELATLRVGGEELAVLAYRLEGGAGLFDGLTPAERAVAEAVIEGLSNREIGALRGVSLGTVTKHLASVYRKLGVGSRRQLRTLARSRTGGRAR
jgi:DNA-binding CsgD family transcriptional regulator